MGTVVALVLLARVGASTSDTAFVALAWAMIQYTPGAVPAGIWKALVTVAIAPPARGPTGASPSTVSLGASSTGSVERYRRDVDAAAPPAVTARFFTT